MLKFCFTLFWREYERKYYVTKKRSLPWSTQCPVDGERAKPGRHTQLTPLSLDKRMHTARMSHLAQFGSSAWVITRKMKRLD